MRIVDLTIDHALAVCRRMRAEDRACLDAALGPGVEADAFAIDRWRTDGPAWAGLVAGQPEVIFGLTLATAWSCTAWLVATDRLEPHSWRNLLRFAGTVKATVLQPGTPASRGRIEAHVLSEWAGARRLADRLGLQHEGTRRAAGSGGEDIEVWAAIAPRG